MADHPLNGAFARVVRAEEHLADLRHLLAEVLRKQENSVVLEFDSKIPPKIIPRLPQYTYVDVRIGILIGETCYNLRAALDYLIFELARLDSGVAQANTQFIIEDRAQVFVRHARVRLKGLNASHKAAIERLQPYHGIGWTRALRDFSNPDKHREFVAIGGNATVTFWPETDPAYASIRAPIRRAVHPIFGEMNVKVHFLGKVTFSDGSPIIKTLEEIKTGVARTIDTFDPEFER